MQTFLHQERHLSSPSVFSKPRLVTCLLYPDFMSLDVCGPMQVFSTANELLKKRQCSSGYQLRLLAVTVDEHAYSIPPLTPTQQAIASSSGIKLVADGNYQEQHPDEIDTLLIPGGAGVDAQCLNTKLIEWLRNAEPHINRIGSICSGALLLAQTGLLNGQRATTHWERLAQLKHSFPEVIVDSDCLHTFDPTGNNGNRHIFTSAGVTAGIDLALALIEDDYDRGLALAVARHLVMYFKRAGGQKQFSELLPPNVKSERLAVLLEWIGEHLADDLSLTTLAEHAHLSARTLDRLFRKELNISPGRYIERLRVETARTLLDNGEISIHTVAHLTGFKHTDSLRRIFHKYFSVSPNEYKRR